MPVVWLIGDSTIEDNTPPFRGWGQLLGEYLPGIPVCNHAMAGRSTKSFLAEGRLQPGEDSRFPGGLQDNTHTRAAAARPYAAYAAACLMRMGLIPQPGAR